MRLEVRRPIISEGETGFTLLETLIGLIILSLASLAMMQSTISMLSSSERAISISERSVEGVLQRQGYVQLVSSFVRDWDEGAEARFRGSADIIITQAAVDLRSGAKGVSPLTLSLVQISEAELHLEALRDNESVVVANFAAQRGEFSYLGKDRMWYSSWPPRVVPSSGMLNDNLLSLMPEWPEAIMLEVFLNRGSTVVWVERVEHSSRPLFVSDDF